MWISRISRCPPPRIFSCPLERSRTPLEGSTSSTTCLPRTPPSPQTKSRSSLGPPAPSSPLRSSFASSPASSPNDNNPGSYLISPETFTLQETVHRDLLNRFRTGLPPANPKTPSLMMEGPLERPSPVIRYSTTAKRWSILRATNVTNVCRSLYSSLFAFVDDMPGHNTGYKSFDPSHPCRRCWEKYSKPYSGPIVYSSWNDGPSNRQRPLSYLRSSATSPSLSPSRSLSSIANQVRNDLSSVPSNSDRRSHPPSSPAAYPPPRFPVPPPLPARPQSDYTMNRSTSSAWTRNGPSSPPVLRPGDPRIGGNLCWNCHGSGRTFGFLLLTNNTCDLCGGVGRLL